MFDRKHFFKHLSKAEEMKGYAETVLLIFMIKRLGNICGQCVVNVCSENVSQTFNSK